MCNKLSKSVLTLALLFLSGVALANGLGNESQPITYLIKFVVSGTPIGLGEFLVNGKGYAPILTNTGNVLDNVVPGLEVAKLEGAQIQILNDENQPVTSMDQLYEQFGKAIVNFTCLSSSCQITLNDGTVLQSDSAEVPLKGRMAMVYGTIANNDNHTPVRILGCGGLVGVEGPMTGWKGSICFNGEFNIEDFFNGSTNPMLTGGSNCTITMHDPKPIQFPAQ